MPISATWNIVKDISSIGKKIFDKKVSDEVRKEIQEMIDKSSELYDRIVALEDERQANRQLISELQEKINRTKNFKREFKQYKPHQLESGALVYVYDTMIHSNKPLHYICTKCVDGSVISILQPKDVSCYELICHECNSNYVMRQKVNGFFAVSRNSNSQ
ncbi:hypothetical protein [Xenorhabdus taiwanensis]|uniref:Phage protein n=1 Tax=Xenorhabdus taiwanensis TaxID=3085177 RepID=A0ABN7C5U6_9GAMM|nr:hypothetical protein TCT1_22500 [Xenorhabdus sp. TCT-1]BET97758.1 hypothetical protein TCT1_26790 [Xenorhabdus sp. TCT-1]